MKKTVIGAFALTALSSAAIADDPDELFTEEVLISGGLTPVSIGETGRAYTIITGEQLRARGTRYVADALRQVPGLAVSRTGGFGGLTQIRVRGNEGNQVLVLVDGLEISTAAEGEVDFGSLSVTDIERIEVIRGPQSALFGSNAAAGVIQIFTRRGRRDSMAFRGQVEGGSDGTALLGLNLSGGGETWDAAFGAQIRHTDGFNVATGTGDREGEMDGDRKLTLTGRANWDVTPELSLGANVFFVDRESEFDNQVGGVVVDANNTNNAKDFAIGLFGEYEMFGGAFVNKVNLDFTQNTSDSLGGFTFLTDSRRIKAGYQGSLTFKTGEVEHTAIVLTEVEEERNRTNLGVDETRTLIGFGGEYRVIFGPIAIQSSARYDIVDEFENALTFAVSGSYDFDATGTRLHGSVGRGITNPTFSEQFGFFGTFVGNPNLIPERIFMWDVGVEQAFFDDRVILDITYFQGKATNEIGSVAIAPGVSTPVNATGESPRKGVELSLTALPMENLAITGSYTYTLARDAGSGRAEVRRPRHLASLDATYTFLEGRATLNGNVIYNGAQFDNDFATFPATPTRLDSFVLVGVQGSYEFTPEAEVYLRIENATNADYQEVLNFETQGLAGFAGLRLAF